MRKEGEYLVPKMLNNELLFVFYLWMFILVKPILEVFPGGSFFILLLCTVIVLSLYIFINLNDRSLFMVDTTMLFFILLVEIVVLTQIAIYSRGNMYDIQYYFIIFGYVPIFLYSGVTDYKRVLKYYGWFSIITYIMYFSEPFTGYPFTDGYMGFGYSVILPAYIGIYLFRKLYKRNILLVLELACLAQAVVFSNRGVMLGIALFVIAYHLVFSRKNIKTFYTHFLAIGIVITILLKLQDLVEWLYHFTSQMGFSSYSLLKFINLLEGYQFDQFLSGREMLWQNAYQMIMGNPVLGSGIGAFTEKYGVYTHNMFLDLMIHFGLIGTLVVTAILLIFLKRFLKLPQNYEKIFMLVIVCLAFPKLLLSTNYYSDFYLWIIVFYGLKQLTRQGDIKMVR